MRNVVYISTKASMGFNEVIQLPFAVLLSYLKHLRIMEIEQTPEGREALYKQSAIHQTEPDLMRFRQHT